MVTDFFLWVVIYNFKYTHCAIGTIHKIAVHKHLLRCSIQNEQSLMKPS